MPKQTYALVTGTNELVLMSPGAQESLEDEPEHTEMAPALPNVQLKCLHLICVRGPEGTRHHVVVDPTRSTERAIREWQESGQARGITVEDRAGLFSCGRPMTVLDVTTSYGTTVITTDC